MIPTKLSTISNQELIHELAQIVIKRERNGTLHVVVPAYAEELILEARNRIEAFSHFKDLFDKPIEGVQSDIVETMNNVDSKTEELNECPDFENEVECFAYSLPHTAEGIWPQEIDCTSVEARTKYGVRHLWSYEQVRKIARHFLELKGGAK